MFLPCSPGKVSNFAIMCPHHILLNAFLPLLLVCISPSSLYYIINHKFILLKVSLVIKLNLLQMLWFSKVFHSYHLVMDHSLHFSSILNPLLPKSIFFLVYCIIYLTLYYIRNSFQYLAVKETIEDKVFPVFHTCWPLTFSL